VSNFLDFRHFRKLGDEVFFCWPLPVCFTVCLHCISPDLAGANGHCTLSGELACCDPWLVAVTVTALAFSLSDGTRIMVGGAASADVRGHHGNEWNRLSGHLWRGRFDALVPCLSIVALRATAAAVVVHLSFLLLVWRWMTYIDRPPKGGLGHPFWSFGRHISISLSYIWKHLPSFHSTVYYHFIKK
jgi:hypothetical protein